MRSNVDYTLARRTVFLIFLNSISIHEQNLSAKWIYLITIKKKKDDECKQRRCCSTKGPVWVLKVHNVLSKMSSKASE